MPLSVVSGPSIWMRPWGHGDMAICQMNSQQDELERTCALYLKPEHEQDWFAEMIREATRV